MSSTSEAIDRFSNMPEDVLSHILSLMPTKFAVRTSILSKLWRYNWTLIYNLDFNDGTEYFDRTDSLSKFVERVLNLCQTSQVRTFRLHHSSYGLPNSSVLNWISKAIELNVCELDLQVINLDLPMNVFTCKTLTKLRLNSPLPHWKSCPSSINLPCLKSLDIIVCNRDSVDKAFKVIHGCPILESLSLKIVRCGGEDYKFDIPTLKRLILSIAAASISFTHKVVLNVTNLEYLFVDGILCSTFLMEDWSSLVEAKVSCEVRCDNLWVKLLKQISGVKYFSSNIEYSRAIINQAFPFPLPVFPNLKQLELKGFVNINWLAIYFESSSMLEHVCVEKPKGSCWDEPKPVSTCMIMNLKTMKYTKTTGAKSDIQFLKFILSNGKVLEMLTVECDDISLKKERRLLATLSTFAKDYTDCHIHFVGNWRHSTSYETNVHIL